MMKDTKNISIVMLCVLSAILITVFALAYNTDEAVADTSIRGGDYILVTGSYSRSMDLLYIIDVANQKINVYAPDENNAVLRMLDQASLKQVFKKR